MPPILAAVLTTLFIAYVFFRDYRTGYLPSKALWIPCLWLLVLGSRSITEWMYLGAPIEGGSGDATEGSPVDRSFFFVLMALGLVVLAKRSVSLEQVLKNNKAWAILVLYCGLSILWSDFPFVAFKRWIKGLGDPIMVLIILTEPNPLKAAEIVLRVCTHLLVPTSILWIKYYPHYGKVFSPWGGMAVTGVTQDKNMLGFTLMVYALFLVWRLYSRWGQKSSSRIDTLIIPLVFLYMVGWLFANSDSKTPLLSLFLALGVFFVLGVRSVRNHFTAFVMVVVLTFGMLEWSFNITSAIVESAGRDTTFTGRTEIWAAVLEMQEQPILGYGMDSFWLGDRLKNLQARWFFKPTQPHNGYIETYLNLGLVGCVLLAGLLVACYMKFLARLSTKDEEWAVFARLGMGFLFADMSYNYTESAFKMLHFLDVMLLLFMMGCSYHWGKLRTPTRVHFPTARTSEPNETRSPAY